MTATPLAGIRVLEFTHTVMGPTAGLIMAELGADVSHIRPHLSELSRPEELRQTARILGRLYDGIECQGLLPALCDAVGREAGVPVYDGLASNRHATARLAALLGADEPPERLREIVLQTVLLSTLA